MQEVVLVRLILGLRQGVRSEMGQWLSEHRFDREPNTRA